MIIRKKYDEELNIVFKKLIEMCHDTEIAVSKSIDVLKNNNVKLAKTILEEEIGIDKKEKEIEKECLNILLMEQPVARDFREISATLKIITDLERIADQAADIAKITLNFKNNNYGNIASEMDKMSKLAIGILKDAIQSYINEDVKLAKSLDRRDDEVDELFESIKNLIIKDLNENHKNAEEFILLMIITKYLERIADHAVNIGEWTEYLVNGSHK